MSIQEQCSQFHFWFDVSGINNEKLQTSVENCLRAIAGPRATSCDAWSILEGGEFDALPRNVIVLADLYRVARAYLRLDPHSLTRAVREMQVYFFVFVRTQRDQKYAALVDDLVRACDSRFTVWDCADAEGEAWENWVRRAIASIDPHAIVDIRYSSFRKCFWIQFGDGLNATISLSELDLGSTGREVLPDTVIVSPEDPETVELLDDKGEKFEIDSRSLRAMVDPAVAATLKRESEDESVKVGERLKRKRTSLKISQEELARRTGLEQALISKLECGRHEPRFDTLRKYAEGLGLSIAELLEA